MSNAKYIGRVGGLAVALGVGMAIATTPGVGWADDTGTASSGGTAGTAGATGTGGPTESEGTSTATGTTAEPAGTSTAADTETDGASAPAFGAVDAPESGTSGASVRRVPPGMAMTTGGADSSTKSNSDTSPQGDVTAESTTAATTAPGPVAESTARAPEAPAAVTARVGSSNRQQQRMNDPTGAPGVHANTLTATGNAVPSRPEISQPPRTVVAVGVQQPAAQQPVTAVNAKTYVPSQADFVAQAISAAPTAPTESRSTTVSAVVLAALATAGLGPLAPNGPLTPFDSPLELALMAVGARPRQFAQAVAEETRSLAVSPTLTSQTLDSLASEDLASTDDGQQTFALMATAAETNSPPVVTGVTQGSPDQSTGAITGLVTATDQDGNTLSYSLSGPQPAGGSVRVNADGTFSYTPSESARLAAGPYSTVTFDRFTVVISDGQATTTTDVSVPVLPTRLNNEQSGVTGASPYGVVVVGRWAYVANQGANTVTAIDTLNPSLSQTITVGSAPTYLVASPVGSRADVANRLYVTNRTSGTVSVINTLTNTVIDTIPATKTIDAITVGSRPESITINADGTRVYVANYGNNTVSVIDTTTSTPKVIATIAVGPNPRGIAFAQTVNGPRVYAVNSTAGTVSVINAATNTLVDTNPVTKKTIDPIRVGSTPQQVAVSPDGKWAYVTDYGSDSVSVINTATNTVDGTPIPAGATPVGVAVSADGSLLYVANGDDRVTIFDTRTRAVHSVVQIDQAPELNFPHIIALGPDGSLYVTDYADQRLRVVSSRRGNTAPVATADPKVGTPNPADGAVSGSAVKDWDGDALTYSVTQPSAGTVTMTAAGGYTFTPTQAARNAAAGPGPYVTSFTVVATDDGQLSTSVTVTDVPILPTTVANHPPVESGPPFVADPDPESGGVVYGSVSVVDPDDDVLSYTLESAPAGGTVYLMDTGGGDHYFAYMPTEAARDAAARSKVEDYDRFTVTVSDGRGGTIQVPVTVTISPKAGIVTAIKVGNDPVAVAVTGPTEDYPYAPDRAYAISVDPSSYLGAVSVIDTDPTSPTYDTYNKVIAVIPLNDTQVTSVAATADGRRVYVAGYDTVSVIDTNPTSPTYNQVVDTVEIPDMCADAGCYGSTTGLQDVTVTSDGSRVYALRGYTTDGGWFSSVSVFDTANNNEVISTTVVYPTNDIEVTPDGTRLYAAQIGAWIEVFDANTMTSQGAYRVTTPGDWPSVTNVAISPDGTRAYVVVNPNVFSSSKERSLSVIATDPTDSTTYNKEIATITLPDGANDVAVSADSSRLYVTQSDGKTVTVIDTATRQVIGTLTTDQNSSPNYYQRAIAVAPDGTVYVTDAGDDMLYVVTVGSTSTAQQM